MSMASDELPMRHHRELQAPNGVVRIAYLDDMHLAHLRRAGFVLVNPLGAENGAEHSAPMTYEEAELLVPAAGPTVDAVLWAAAKGQASTIAALKRLRGEEAFPQ